MTSFLVTAHNSSTLQRSHSENEIAVSISGKDESQKEMNIKLN